MFRLQWDTNAWFLLTWMVFIRVFFLTTVLWLVHRAVTHQRPTRHYQDYPKKVLEHQFIRGEIDRTTYEHAVEEIEQPRRAA